MMGSSNRNPGLTNPFRAASVFNRPLKAETCQQIHADALRRAVQDPQAGTTPSGVHTAELRARARRYGPQVYLAHPADIERHFRGVTLSVYQEIESLYCSRLGRSWATVFRILRAMAREAGTAVVEEEAVWAICLHLDELRARRTAVTLERLPSAWWLVELALASSTSVSEASGSAGTQQLAVLVIDPGAPQALALRTGEQRAEAELRSLAIYDALALERRPAPLGGGGLVWRVPACLMVEEELPGGCWHGCAALGIPVELATRPLPLVEELGACWVSEQARRTITPGRQALVFESLLNRVFGTSPQRAREERERALGGLVGYAQDPAELCPALRVFLPERPATINQEGEVAFDGLHYADRVLCYWPGTPVTVRRSQQTEAALWVYLEGEVLCQAWARELARRDGSYRAARAGR